MADPAHVKAVAPAPSRPLLFWLAALVVAWSVDLLFWGQPLGISLAFYVFLALAACFVLLRSERVRPVWSAWALAVVALLASLVTIFRAEPFTRLINALLAVGLLLTLAMTLRVGRWLEYNLFDMIVSWIELLVAALSRGARVRLLPSPVEGAEPPWRRALRAAAPVLRGLLLALPLVLLLGSLLTFADPIFADLVRHMFAAFDLRRLPEYLFRTAYVLVLTYLFLGMYLHAVLPRADQAERAPSKGIGRFLGSTEAFVVLGSVNLLFAAFVAVQFRYFFGGQANITAAGYTYADYARRGFFELVSVAVLSLGLSFVLGTITRRNTPSLRRAFTALSVLLMALVWVILVSAFMRLNLYEDAYGFTRLRTYTHIFIPWLGLLLLITIVLQAVQKERWFGAALLAVMAGFCLTLGMVSVDGFIARQNLARASDPATLDSYTLFNLSEDAVPVMAQAYRSPQTSAGVRQKLGAILSCKAYPHRYNLQNAPISWQGYHPVIAQAEQIYAGVDLSPYPVVRPDPSLPFVQLPGEKFWCVPNARFDSAPGPSE